MKTPSSQTSAIPDSGPRKLIQLTAVPVKVKSAWSPAVDDSAAVPLPVLAEVPLHARAAFSLSHVPAYTIDGSVSSSRARMSNPSTTTWLPVAAGFFAPVASIARVCCPIARLEAVYTLAWTSTGEKVSICAWKAPSR